MGKSELIFISASFPPLKKLFFSSFFLSGLLLSFSPSSLDWGQPASLTRANKTDFPSSFVSFLGTLSVDGGGGGGWKKWRDYNIITSLSLSV